MKTKGNKIYKLTVTIFKSGTLFNPNPLVIKESLLFNIVMNKTNNEENDITAGILHINDIHKCFLKLFHTEIFLSCCFFISKIKK